MLNRSHVWQFYFCGWQFFSGCTWLSQWITLTVLHTKHVFAGEYLLGARRINNGIDWYHLHPKRSNGQYWRADAYNPEANNRAGFGLHPGQISQGNEDILHNILSENDAKPFVWSVWSWSCVLKSTRFSSGCVTVTSSSCWSQLKGVLDSARRQVSNVYNTAGATRWTTIGKLFVS